jgi:hypothetical protein
MREPFDGDITVGVRPEHVRLSDEGSYRGEILATEYLGTTQIVTLATDAGELKARIGSERYATVGDTVGLSFNASTLTLFNSQTGHALRSNLNIGVLGLGGMPMAEISLLGISKAFGSTQAVDVSAWTSPTGRLWCYSDQLVLAKLRHCG